MNPNLVEAASTETNAGTTENRPMPRAHMWQRIPTALTVVALAVFGFWGHHTGWRFGSDSETHQTARARGDGHIVQLVAPATPTYGWCPAHGVYDCPLDHPEVAQLDKLPTVSRGELDRTQRALAVRPRPENSPAFRLSGWRLQFDSKDAVDKTGIDITPTWTTEITEAISASGEVQFDPTQMARVTSRAPGIARYVGKKVGDSVRRGEVLALVDAAEVGKAKSELLQALVQSRLKKKALDNLRAAGASIPERQLKEADAAWRDTETRLLSSEQGLANLGLPIAISDLAAQSIEEVARRIQSVGMPEAAAAQLGADSRTANLLPIHAPLDGTVLSSDVIPGEVVDTSDALFTVVDATRMVAILHVNMDDARFVAVDAPVKFRPDGTRDEVTGKVVWIGTAADEKTRLAPVRVELSNENGRLRASTLGTGRIVLREEPTALVVPNEAVHSFAGNEIVFVRHKNYMKPGGPTEFVVRSVRSGARDGANTEIVVGLLPGEIVATKSSAFLSNELKKSQRSGS